MQCGAPTSGHYALSPLLKGKDIDIRCSPIAYTDREWIGTAPSMTAAESVARAGILWLNEDDSRTFLDPRKEEHVQEGGLVDLEQTRQVMRRNLGAPQLTPELVRVLTRMAGAHVFTEGKASVWAAEGYLSVQAEAGPLVLRTGTKGAVTDALDGKRLGDGPEVTLPMRKGEVRVIRY